MVSSIALAVQAGAIILLALVSVMHTWQLRALRRELGQLRAASHLHTSTVSVGQVVTHGQGRAE
jgi:hypothetical protein